MTKQEAKKLSKSIVGYLCRLVSFERPQDIGFLINDDDDDERDCSGKCKTELGHGLHNITLNIRTSTTNADFIDTVCHELAHAFTSEYMFFYDTYIGEGDEESERAWAVYSRFNEIVAKRLATIFTELWKLHNRKGNK